MWIETVENTAFRIIMVLASRKSRHKVLQHRVPFSDTKGVKCGVERYRFARTKVFNFAS